jgi:hypothetical protein
LKEKVWKKKTLGIPVVFVTLCKRERGKKEEGDHRFNLTFLLKGNAAERKGKIEKK